MKKTKEKIVQLEIDLAKMAQKEAEDLAKRKSLFLDIAAHELRTPISVISLLLQIAERQIEKDKGHFLSGEGLARLRAPVDRLNRLVGDLLDVSRFERGLIALVPIKTDMVSLISECIEEFRVQAPNRIFIFNKPNRIFIFNKPDQSVEANIDPLRINQVLSNLLDNAIKYTTEGPIEVTLVALPNVIRVSVKDYGSGISKDQQEVLFTAFSRGSSNATAHTSGLGLGLSVCKGIIDLHGGTIGIKSEIGKGSTFYFELPKINTEI